MAIKNGSTLVSPIIFGILWIFSCLLILQSVEARVIHVALDGDGTDGASWETAFTSITTGLNASQAGDSLWVKQGRYNEAVELRTGVGVFGGFAGMEEVGQFELRDMEANETIINATGLMESVVRCENVEDATIDGFTLTHGEALIGGGLFSRYSDISVLRSVIVENRALDEFDGNGGGFDIRGGGVTIKESLISDNFPMRAGKGLFIESASVEIADSTIVSSTGFGSGIVAMAGSFVQLPNCLISGHESGGEGGGVQALTSTVEIHGCTITNNFSYRHGGGVYARLSPIQIYDSVISHNTSGNFIFNLGGGLFLDGDSLVENCVISHNHAPRGGGIRIGGNNNVIRDCTIEHNAGALREARFGGGIFFGGGPISANSGLIQNCLIRHNRGKTGGGLYITRGILMVEDTIIRDNSAESVDDTGGFGGGVYLGINAVLNRCVIADNWADKNGGGLFLGFLSEQEDTPISNCLIVSNRAALRGGGVRVSEGEAPGPNPRKFLNCTIAGNRSPAGEGVEVFGDEAAPIFQNCILVNSPTSEVFLPEGATITITHSNVLGGWTGEGNIDEDPLFMDLENGDYRLQINSPSIDAASTTGPSLDLDGNPRPVDVPGRGRDGEGAFDMGAYEFPGAFRNSFSDINRDGRVDARDLLILMGDMEGE